MSGIFIGFIIVIILLVLFVCVISIRTDSEYKEKELYNEDGDHLYYDRSIIEKKEFRKEHPEVKNVRSLRRLIKELFK